MAEKHWNLNWELKVHHKGKGHSLHKLRGHTGMALFGEGINKNTLNQMGDFDGNKLFAHTHIVGLHKVPGEMDFFKILSGWPDNDQL